MQTEFIQVMSFPATLAERWRSFRAAHPKVRIRDAAAQLGTSEAQLLAVSSGKVVRLKWPFERLLPELSSLGRVMALTRNEAAVHEKRGVYLNPEVMGSNGVVHGEEIDLRLFFKSWHLGFAVEEEGKRSLQFFDVHGAAVHKIFLEEGSDGAAWEALVKRYGMDDGAELSVLPGSPPRNTARPDEAVDVGALRAAWKSLDGPHDFFGMLRKLELERTQALRLAGEEWAVAVAPSAFDGLLESVAGAGVPVMIFVGNRGALQIHTGPVQRIVRMKEWINVLDPAFNLHLRTDLVSEAWVVRKPSREGQVTAIELYDAPGDLVLQMFGQRKPGVPERDDWRAQVEALTVPAREVRRA
jgi:putative hemin transport protein